MIRAIHHVAISTPDLRPMCDFYCGLLGFEEISRTAWQPGEAKIDRVMALTATAATAVMLQRGPTCIELFQFAFPAQAPKGGGDRPVNRYGITHLCFDVADVDAAYQRMVDAGVRFHCPPQDFGSVRATYGRDPDGNVFELQELTGQPGFAASPQ
ncbi:MAG: glyoxylase I family protein [Azoarcus sp.]|uniref:Catechol 2,3-dioxygenase n=1 Tax=Aromatoleum tolulyticum TaxID=34027 RepID=A0A1N6PYG1_9RHOO|nr:VOC family protein [Aromatoleum tolulyticum]MCK9987863.1 glyoxylase I family protein [Azoarcus sp.]SIQ09326.1 Catechol 2,3-dioxygenase [Aromatoleum tolulyticum]